MDIGSIIEIRIEDMLDDGRGFGRCEGLAVFVSGGCELEGGGFCAAAVPGDLVRAKILKVKKNAAEAELIEITEASPDRVNTECPFFGQCGGCTLQELSYEAQLRLKTEQVRAKISRLGGIDEPLVHNCMGAENLKYYRNKAVFAVGPHGEVGFKKAKSNFVMDIDDCMLQSDTAMVSADALRTFLRERGGRNLGIGQMTVKTAFGTGEVMVVLEAAEVSDVGGYKKGKGKKKATGGKFEIQDVETLVEMLDDAVSSLNYSDDEESEMKSDAEFWSLESVAVINNGKCRIVAGKSTITEEFLREDGHIIRFEISPQSFFQVNPEQMIKLYDKAAEYAGLTGGETVLDLYCGAGTIGIWMLDELRSRDEESFSNTRVVGIESVKPAVIDANRNSVINNIVNTRYFAGKAEEELPGMMGLADLWKWNEVNERVKREPEIRIGRSGSNSEYVDAIFAEKADAVILDPPRAGCAEALLSAVVTASPDRIVYVSCDPGTLARDIKYLTANGYEFIEATPVDQFPWTSHCEVTTLLKRL